MSHSSGRPPRFPIFQLSLLCLLTVFGLPAFAQRPKVLAPHKPVPPVVSPRQPWHKPSVPRSLVGGLWMTDASMKSYLHITNDLVTSSLSVTPVLWLSNGIKLTLPVVNLEPSGTAIVSINQALADQGLAPFATLSGYVELDYQWPWDALCATVRNVDLAHSVIFNYGLPLALPASTLQRKSDEQTQTSLQQQSSAQVLEGLWWKQEPNVTGFVALINPSSAPIPVDLTVTNDQGYPLGQESVIVSSHGTKMLELAGLPEAAGSSGGLRVQYTGAPNDLLVSGGLRDDTTGYSTELVFAPPPSTAAQTSAISYAELGLMTGVADPMLFFPAGTVFTPYSVARNISSQPVAITPNIWWMAGGSAKSATLPQVTLEPHQSINLNIPTLLAQVGLKDYNGSVNVVLDVRATSTSGAILLSSGSVDQKNNYVFPVAPQVVKESIAKSLSYWSVANGDDTMITLWNPADEPQDFKFTLFYTGGHYAYPLHLEPRASQMFNVSEILHTGISDAEGNIIPMGIHEGSAELSGPEGEAQHILAALDAATYNVQKATCGQYCKTCQGATNSWVTDNPFAVAVSGTHQLTLTVQNHSGTQVDDTSAAAWSSSNTSVATVSSGLVHGVAVGSLQASSFDDGYPIYSSGCYSYMVDCPLFTGIGGGAPGTVRLLYASRLISTVFSRTASCATGQAGWDRGITEKIVDQSGQYWTYDGILIQEAITIGRNDFGLACTQTQNYNSCSGSETTYNSGTFDDRFYFCSPACTSPTNNETDATQVLYYNGVPVQSANVLVYKCGSITWNAQ